MFNQNDLKQIDDKGIDLKTVENQINHFKTGFPFIKLASAASSGKGLHCYSREEAQKLATYFDDRKADYEILKFVPASGAASRMFKDLQKFKDEFRGTKEDIDQYLDDKSFGSPYYFFTNLEKFAFYNELQALLEKDGFDIKQLIQNLDFLIILDYFLTEQGLNYTSRPKGLLLFHDYDDNPRLAVEEHLVEGAHYSTNAKKTTRVHLTVSPEHKEKFLSAIEAKSNIYEKQYDVSFDISFSQQKSSTDTIAVDLENNPFRNSDGSLLFRPGGHGALMKT